MPNNSNKWMDPAYKYNLTQLKAEYESFRADRSEYESEWKEISNWLLPARGIYQLYSKPRKKRLTLPKVINTSAREALRVLTSGMQGGLTSPMRPWFSLAWENDEVKEVPILLEWLESSQKRLTMALHKSNFYQVIHSMYTELAGFGTSSIYLGEDGASDSAPFRFECLTAGEYAYQMTIGGKADIFFRTIYFTARQLIKTFDAALLSESIVQESRQAAQLVQYYTVVQCIYEDKFQDKDFTSVYFMLSTPSGMNLQHGIMERPLKVGGFHEMPYLIGRWELVGQDIYGLGAGSEALPNIRRLQEMEKAFLIATHKSINPPLNAPSRLKGKVTTLPGGVNYYSNVNETVTSMYDVRMDYNGVMAAVERVEERINKIFYNDIFLTASRDPNASPLRTGEVEARMGEQQLRIGPIIERVQYEVLRPLIERAFNIMLRKGLFEPLDENMAMLAGDYKVSMISPLAQQQKLGEATGIERFLQGVGAVAQFDPSAIDAIDTDDTVDQMADIFGPPASMIRPLEERTEIRQQRAQQQKEQAEKEEALIAQREGGQAEVNRSTVAKNYSDAGVNLDEVIGGGGTIQ